MPELAPDPVVVLGWMSAPKPRAHISDHKEVAMKLPIGPKTNVHCHTPPSH